MKITPELKEKAEKLLTAIQEQLERLPDRDIFGGSNLEDKKEAENNIADLKLFLERGECRTIEVHSYLYGNDDYILGDWIV